MSKMTCMPNVWKWFCILLCLAAWLDCTAGLKMPVILGSGMVLQRNSEIMMWGWNDPGETVTIVAGWTRSEVSTETDKEGNWQVRMPTGNAGGPYELIIKDKDEEIRLENILLGEVWICSGQSNIQFTIDMLGGWDKTFPHEKDELIKSGFQDIRLFTVTMDTSFVRKNDCNGQWKLPDTSTIANFSATAWFFGVELSKKLGVPIGLIVSAWGGTPAEAWTPLQVIESDPELEYYRSDPNRNAWFPTAPSVLFNAMIAPLTRTNMRGVLWYQGESNVMDASTYSSLFPAMIRSWRQAWNLGNFPFYYVQIAPFTYDRAVVGALLREAQLKSMAVHNTGMVVTLDIAGDVTDIHPKNKQEVGRRLAAWALSETYGKEIHAFSGPVYTGYEKEGTEIRLKFENAHGLSVKNRFKEPTGFMIAGEDRRFVPAKVRIVGNTILVRSDKIKDPLAVRYAFTNTSEATLFNGDGLPASSFRTDDWPVVTDVVFMRTLYDQRSRSILYSLSTSNSNAAIHYTLDRSEPDCNSQEYAGQSIMLPNSVTLLARACVNGIPSESIGSWEIRQHKGVAAEVTYSAQYSEKYTAGGAYGLVDGLEGTLAFNDGTWQGFEGDDLEMVIDLGQNTMIRKVNIHFLSDTNSWIFLPRYVEFRTSKNGLNYDLVSRYDNITSLTRSRESLGRQIVSINSILMRNSRYLKIKADNIGVCPPGHPGEGLKSWLFIDEVVLE